MTKEIALCVFPASAISLDSCAIGTEKCQSSVLCGKTGKRLIWVPRPKTRTCSLDKASPRSSISTT